MEKKELNKKEEKWRGGKEKKISRCLWWGIGGISVMPGSYSSHLTFNQNKIYYSSPNTFEGGAVSLGFG